MPFRLALALFCWLAPLLVRAESSEVVREEVRSSPRLMREVHSATMCIARLVRAAAKDEIAKEQKYAREGGGMVSPVKLYGLQRVMRAADEKRDDALKQLGKKKPLSCKHERVSPIIWCALVDSGDQSSELDRIRAFCEEVRPKVLVGLVGMHDLLIDAERWSSLR